MSFEILLLLFVFLVLPLLEQLVRNARKRQEGEAPPAPVRQAPRPQRPPRREPHGWDDDEDDEEEEEAAIALPALPPPPPPLPATRPAPPVRRTPAAAARLPVPREVLRARQAREARMRQPVIDAGQERVARSRRRRTRLAAELSHPSGLRRAVVFMTVLGPCRANEPYSQPG